MSYWILMVILSGEPHDVAVFPQPDTCRIVADAMNTHPNLGEGGLFVCQERSEI